MIRVRSLPLNDEEATELASRLRKHGDPIGMGVAERLERGVLMGTAVIGTSRPEALVLLSVIDGWTPQRLREVAAELRTYVGSLEDAPSVGRNR